MTLLRVVWHAVTFALGFAFFYGGALLVAGIALAIIGIPLAVVLVLLGLAI